VTTAEAEPAPNSIPEQPLELLEAIEQAFAEHPTFGDPNYILGQLRQCLERRLERIAPRIEAAGELLEALTQAGSTSLDHVIADTVVRCAILNAHGHLETAAEGTLSLEDCEEIFGATTARLRDSNYGSPLNDGSLQRLGDEPHHGWIWSDEHDPDIFWRSYRRLLEDRYQAVPVVPTEEEVANLEEGARLLGELCPTLSPSALAHAHVIALVPSAGGWTGIASASQFRLGGSIFIGRFLQSPWWVAEHLLHEALHQKLYDFRQGHLLLQMDAGGDRNVVKVASIWNSPKLNDANRWDVHRVYAAFHVYAHLALFSALAEQRAEEFEDTYGPIQAMTSSEKAVQRAHYLGEQLKEQCWDHLGVAGQSLADWLISVLNLLDPAPPPKGAYLHLCLDLYEREAGQVAASLLENGATLRRELPALAKDEIEGAQRVLDSAGADEALGRLNEILASFAEKDLGARFPELRIEIGSALLSASSDGYMLGHATSDQMLRELVAYESQRLFALSDGYPLSVADAKVRAAQFGFRSCCRDEVGRLLSVLTACVSSGGRVLEIGTGTGVGTGWIGEGLEGRTDVEVVTIEVDPALAESTRNWSWPANVRIVTAEGTEAFSGLGAFDLVFADAAPVKYGDVDAVLQALNPGGILVIDDLGAGARTTDDQLAEKDALRHALLEDPSLLAVELDTSSGLIVALKRRAADGSR
jgi:predicted O-methyltransferase YrrM